MTHDDDYFRDCERRDRADLASGNLACLFARHYSMIEAICARRVPHDYGEVVSMTIERLHREYLAGQRYPNLPYRAAVVKVTGWTIKEYWEQQKKRRAVECSLNEERLADEGEGLADEGEGLADEGEGQREAGADHEPGLDPEDMTIADLDGNPLLDVLEPRERRAVELVWIKGYTHAEAAEVLGVTVNYLYVILHRAREKMKNHLDNPR